MMKSGKSVRIKQSEGIDRISSLPEPLISHILSLLPTKFVVSTSLLSTRWKFLWTSISNLEFDGRDYPLRYPLWDLKSRDTRRKKFTQFVNRVLLLNTSCIQNFHLICHHQVCDPLDIDSWVCTAVRRTVQKLELDLMMTQTMKLPLSHLHCKTLAVLKLNRCIHFKIAEAASISFPNLHTLHLSEIEFTIDNNCFVSFPSLKNLLLDFVRYTNEESVHKLFASCSVLESLIITRSSKDNTPNLIISIPSLISLKICLCNLSSSGSASRVQLDTPALQYLSVKNNSLCYFNSVNLPSLLEASIDLGHVDTIEDNYRTNISNFFGVLFNAKLLSLEGYAVFEVISSISANIAQVFRNVKRLEINSSSCWCWPVVLNNLLESMDNLEHLVFVTLTICWGKYDRWWMEPLRVPMCLLRRVTTIYFNKVVCNCADEVEMVSYFLKNAKVLKMLKLGKIVGIEEAEKLIFMQKLVMSPRGSHECHVDVGL